MDGREVRRERAGNAALHPFRRRPALDTPQLGRATTLPLSNIKPGYAPRRYFDPKNYDYLVPSLRRRGIIHPMLVRPFDDIRRDGGQEGHGVPTSKVQVRQQLTLRVAALDLVRGDRHKLAHRPHARVGDGL